MSEQPLNKRVPIGFASPGMWDGLLPERMDAWDEYEKGLRILTEHHSYASTMVYWIGLDAMDIVWAREAVRQTCAKVWYAWLAQRRSYKGDK